MADKFTIVVEYDRYEILELAQRFKDQGIPLQHARNGVSSLYPAWDRDPRTSILVELMYRDEHDDLRPLYEEKLAELDAKNV